MGRLLSRPLSGLLCRPLPRLVGRLVPKPIGRLYWRQMAGPILRLLAGLFLKLMEKLGLKLLEMLPGRLLGRLPPGLIRRSVTSKRTNLSWSFPSSSGRRPDTVRAGKHRIVRTSRPTSIPTPSPTSTSIEAFVLHTNPLTGEWVGGRGAESEDFPSQPAGIGSVIRETPVPRVYYAFLERVRSHRTPRKLVIRSHPFVGLRAGSHPHPLPFKGEGIFCSLSSVRRGSG